MDGSPQLHSVPAFGESTSDCLPRARRAHPGLRGLVLGYAGFGRPGATPLAHRLMPLAATVLIIDVDRGAGLVTGPRAAGRLCERERWGHGVSIGLSPAGASALLAVPSADLAEGVLPLTDVTGTRAAELVDRLAAAPTWEARCATLDRLLLPHAGAEDTLADAAWHRLHRDSARVPEVAAALGVSRRLLERVCRARLGHSPGRIARIARLQRAIGLIRRGLPLATVAARAGYADQPHLTRESVALAGLTPGSLCTILQEATGVRRRRASR
ncbi:helix-turn-helix transcriptional regulator [Catenuloplanes sp. NPDC051500]|uniref:helix-turn-helix transcriptional regulator n=1 Tax=Catenuloplanes sp. NPDC051500 TaxID=3363959 RepID=UPI0037A2CF2E